MLLAGILSDTLVLKMSTTTREDEEAVRYLSGILGIDPLTFGTDLIGHGINLEQASLGELLSRDVKNYPLFGCDVVISQVMMVSDEFVTGKEEEIARELERLRKETGADLYLVLFTNVLGNRSHVFAAGEHILLQELGFENQPVVLEGVMSRKKDFLPPFGQKLRNV